eukprot:UN00736
MKGGICRGVSVAKGRDRLIVFKKFGNTSKSFFFENIRERREFFCFCF